MARRLLGSATTNSSGVASLSYSSVGVGKLDIIAVATIDGDTISSEQHILLDCIKYDNGVSGDCNDSMWDSTTNMSRGAEYTTISSSSIVNKYTAITGDIAVELDLMTDMAVGGEVMSIRNNSTGIEGLNLTECSMTTNEWKHIKITIQDNKLTVVGGTISNVDVTGYNRFYIRASANYHTYFKNLRIYSV